MNYYERHIGDYLKDTTHLSLLEHGVYCRLLDVYYTRERPIDDAEAVRLISARTPQERAAVKAVLAEFFHASGDPTTWRHKRCDSEIERFQDKQRKAKASANARWSQTERNANASSDAMRTHSEGNAPSNQTPDTREEISTLAGAPQRPSADGPQLALVEKKSEYRRPNCPTEKIVDLFHEHLPSLPRVDILSDGRKRHVSARWADVCGESKFDRDQGLEWFAWFFGHVAKSAFLTGRVKGRSGDPFRCTFDFLMTPEKFVRVIENFYHKDSA